MDLQLGDKTALVVAASKGIGHGVARALAREGCRVVIASSNGANLSKAKSAILDETGVDVATCVMDVRSRDSIEEASALILAEHKRIDILVTNSPGPQVADAATVDTAMLMGALDTNLMSVIQLCQRFLPPMMENRFGRVINLTSSTGKEPDPGMVLSNVTRAGVLAYAKTLSREVAQYGITSNSILTGSVLTGRSASLLESEAKSAGKDLQELLAQAAESIPVGYIATPEQFCHAIAFLASPLSMYINGVSLAIDGGYMRAI